MSRVSPHFSFLTFLPFLSCDSNRLILKRQGCIPVLFKIRNTLERLIPRTPASSIISDVLNSSGITSNRSTCASATYDADPYRYASTTCSPATNDSGSEILIWKAISKSSSKSRFLPRVLFVSPLRIPVSGSSLYGR